MKGDAKPGDAMFDTADAIITVDERFHEDTGRGILARNALTKAISDDRRRSRGSAGGPVGLRVRR
jgi:hypothetical protein